MDKTINTEKTVQVDCITEIKRCADFMSMSKIEISYDSFMRSWDVKFSYKNDLGNPELYAGYGRNIDAAVKMAVGRFKRQF